MSGARNLAVIGAQWGDEGKGKIVDLLCEDFDVVARRHSSLLKDYAPLAGRDIRVTARFGF